MAYVWLFPTRGFLRSPRLFYFGVQGIKIQVLKYRHPNCPGYFGFIPSEHRRNHFRLGIWLFRQPYRLGLLFIVCTAALNADEIDSSLKESDSSEIVQAPRQMTEKQMNDLFGEDPYLGQTSYLQSPDGFSQREK